MLPRPTSKLIIVDGVSGSGKTVTCRWLEQYLQGQHVPAIAIYEADVPHPLHWWHYWDGARHLPPDFDHVAPSSYLATSLAKWQQFIIHVQASDAVTIVEGALYCLAIGFFMQGNLDRQQLIQYSQQVEAIMQAVDPTFIYLRQSNLAAHTRMVWKQRGAAIEHELIGNLERMPYLRRRQLRGFAGIVELWQATQDLTDELFAEHTMRKLAIEVTEGDWDAAYQNIRAAVRRDDSPA